MRKLLLASFFLTLASTWAMSQAPVPELMWYQFDGAGTSVPNDASSPVQPTATIMGAVTQGSPGICNGALIGSGITSTTDYLNTGWAPNLGTGSWTISVRVSGISASGTLFYIFGDAGTGSFRCFTNGVAGNNNWIIRGTGLTDTYINGGALSTPTMITWVYYNGGGQATMKGYLNGLLVTTVNQGGTFNFTGTGPLKVMGYSANIGAPLGGKMDDFRLYNRALSDAEVAAIYNPVVTGFLGTDQSVCQGDSVTLTAPAGYTYSWSSGQTTSSINVGAAGDYSVTATSTTGCGSGIDTVAVAVATPPAPAISGNGNFCAGDSVMLDAGSGYASYDWSSGDTTQSIYATMGGAYVVMVTDSAGCSGNDTLNVNQNPLPVPTNVPDTAICDGTTFVADAGAGFVSYLWSSSGTGQTENITVAGAYNVAVTDTFGCTGTDSFNVSVNPSPTPDLGADVSFCAGSNATLDAGAGYAAYNWSNSATTQTNMVTSAGNYTVTVTDSLGCTGSDAITVTEDPLPVASFTDNPSGLTVAFTSTSTNASTYAWDFGDSQTSTQQNPSHNYTSAGTYTVTLIVTNPCGSDTSTSTVTVTSVDDGFFSGNVSLYPNPATNQVNLTADLPGTRDLTLSLINAVGQEVLVSQEESVSGAFNTQLNLEALPAGVYFVKLSAGEHQTTLRLVVNK